MTKEAYEAHQKKHGFIVHQEPVVHPKAIASVKGRMNRTETEFSYILEKQKRDGQIDGWAFEPVKLRLADGCYYTPDFMTWLAQDAWPSFWRIVFYEVKGAHIWDDSKVKFKVANEQIQWAEFQMHQKINGQWTKLF
jgi:hypothetical protein